MGELGQSLPHVRGMVPGPRGEAWVRTLAEHECPAFTARRARRAEATGAPHDPIVWSEALGANVVDVDGHIYVDLTGGFGVAAIGHRHPRVVSALRAQSEKLIHALGDLHPSDVKIELLARICALAPFDHARAILGLSGADAVEAALKTATLATGRPGVVAFEGGYHGLSHGPLATCGYSEAFRAPFREQLNPHVRFAPWPAHDDDVEAAVAAVAEASKGLDMGAVLVEPIQGRGGVRLPPPGFLARLSPLCRASGALLVVDEIFTGLGRCGAMLRTVDEGVEPDLLCLGKSLGGGMPVSACVGRADVMAAWGTPDREAIHTGTFFGNPLACAAALATLDVLVEEALPARARELGGFLLHELRAESFKGVREVRGAGLLIGVQLDAPGKALTVARQMLELGYLVLPAGEKADVLQLAPPLVIARPLLSAFVAALRAVLTGLP
jgi:acetylornithine/succinyldiaminopimelate/putrescine aminotransferase